MPQTLGPAAGVRNGDCSKLSGPPVRRSSSFQICADATGSAVADKENSRTGVISSTCCQSWRFRAGYCDRVHLHHSMWHSTDCCSHFLFLTHVCQPCAKGSARCSLPSCVLEYQNVSHLQAIQFLWGTFFSMHTSISYWSLSRCSHLSTAYVKALRHCSPIFWFIVPVHLHTCTFDTASFAPRGCSHLLANVLRPPGSEVDKINHASCLRISLSFETLIGRHWYYFEF